ncbi:MAG: hypothetical protein AB7N76_13685 [Planctomycetota bacterium]
MSEAGWRGFTARDLRRGLLRGLLAVGSALALGLLTGSRAPALEVAVSLGAAGLVLVPLALLEGRGARKRAGGELGNELVLIWVISGLAPLVLALQPAYLQGFLLQGFHGGLEGVTSLLSEVVRQPLSVGFLLAIMGVPFALVSNHRIQAEAETETAPRPELEP